jgi:hypothetical protein
MRHRNHAPKQSEAESGELETFSIPLHSRAASGKGETMKTSKLGMLAASAVLGVVGSAALVTSASAGEEKACYRTHCGKAITGHEGKCGGTVVKDLRDEKSCEVAGGDWTTAENAAQYKAKG